MAPLFCPCLQLARPLMQKREGLAVLLRESNDHRSNLQMNLHLSPFMVVQVQHRECPKLGSYGRCRLLHSRSSNNEVLRKGTRANDGSPRIDVPLSDMLSPLLNIPTIGPKRTTAMTQNTTGCPTVNSNI